MSVGRRSVVAVEALAKFRVAHCSVLKALAIERETLSASAAAATCRVLGDGRHFILNLAHMLFMSHREFDGLVHKHLYPVENDLVIRDFWGLRIVRDLLKLLSAAYDGEWSLVWRLG